MILATLAFVVSVLIGYFIASLLWPANLSRVLAWAFAPALGIGICSIIFIAFRRPMFTVEVIALIVLALLWVFRARPSPPPISSLAAWRPPAVYLLLACAVGMVVSFWMIRVERSPHGDWDATAIWNSHARYLFRDGNLWKTTILHTFHPDYPLLVPSTTARLWRYMERDTPDAAGVLGMLYGLSAVGVLVGVLAQLRSSSHGVLFGLVLLGTPFYVDYSVLQSADIPLSLYIVATVALVCLESTTNSGSRGLLVLAGFLAGCAGWTKNEGLLFIVAASVAFLAPVFRRPREALRRFAAFFAGLTPMLVTIAWFKLTIAPPNLILGGRNYEELLHKLLSPDRYLTVWMQLSNVFWSFGEWIFSPMLLVLAYVALQRLDRKMLLDAGWLQGVFICVFVLAGYAAVYVVTPMDLQWHIGSSAPRLYLHLWPTFLLLAGLVGRNLSTNP
jgi:hypothetical protein